jgi:hypothetical protein
MEDDKIKEVNLEDRKEVSLGGLCGLCGSNSSLPDSSGVLLDSRLNSYRAGILQILFQRTHTLILCQDL